MSVCQTNAEAAFRVATDPAARHLGGHTDNSKIGGEDEELPEAVH
jgi:hypothetical protein